MITRKIKIGNFFNHFSRSIQNIAHHLQSLFDGVISEGEGVCISFFVNKPNPPKHPMWLEQMSKDFPPNTNLEEIAPESMEIALLLVDIYRIESNGSGKQIQGEGLTDGLQMDFSYHSPVRYLF